MVGNDSRQIHMLNRAQKLIINNNFGREQRNKDLPGRFSTKDIKYLGFFFLETEQVICFTDVYISSVINIVNPYLLFQCCTSKSLNSGSNFTVSPSRTSRMIKPGCSKALVES